MWVGPELKTFNYDVIPVVNNIQHCLSFTLRQGTVNTIANLLPTFDTPSVLSSQLKTTEVHVGHLLGGQRSKMH